MTDSSTLGGAPRENGAGAVLLRVAMVFTRVAVLFATARHAAGLVLVLLPISRQELTRTETLGSERAH
jgi:hypothetical protein